MTADRLTNSDSLTPAPEPLTLTAETVRLAAVVQQAELDIGAEATARLLELARTTPEGFEFWLRLWRVTLGNRATFEHLAPLAVVRAAERRVCEDFEPEHRYVDKVNAPLSVVTVAALRDELKSGSYARYRKPRPAGGAVDEGR